MSQNAVLQEAIRRGAMFKAGAGAWLSLVTLLAVPQFAAAHGYVEYPAARQEICDKDGGYWDSQDGSTIPNLACRQAYQQSSWYLEFSLASRLASVWNRVGLSLVSLRCSSAANKTS